MGLCFEDSRNGKNLWEDFPNLAEMDNSEEGNKIGQKSGLWSELSVTGRAPEFLSWTPKDIGILRKIPWGGCGEYKPLKLSRNRRSPCMGWWHRRKTPEEAFFEVCDISVSEFADSVPQADRFGLLDLSIDQAMAQPTSSQSSDVKNS